ncbi:rhamnan synthesis F family protein [Nitrosomonas sp. Is37]|uniref:rhamnan synthesis F family protein n=1 Tax=Nitrosomonas sp. Is37 TaxID=3080535 RepID=UPI00294B4375|nr:rhamnan synthesis F family protein [Nitrosomonas sp. Is37]MDV6344312.1 rhamnan synthesis F family protein [Nitrosomonas sp. Is37]
MKCLCIYTTIGKKDDQVRGRYVPYALKKYKEVAERVVFVSDIQADHPNFDEINEVADLIVRSPTGSIRLPLEGYKLGFAAIDRQELETYDEIIFVDASCYGPVYPIAPILDDPRRAALDFWSVGFFTRKANLRILERILTLNFFTVNRRVAASPAFQKFVYLANG